MKTIPLKPLGDKVIILPLTETGKKGQSKGGIIIPETASKERPEEGLVVAVGPGRIDDNGKLIPLTIKKGQKVIFAKYGPDEIKFEGKDYLIVSESQILAVME
ncbi:MAG: co-chaperone GroES [bacterium]|nr:co-chaperone GroES [bacterium]